MDKEPNIQKLQALIAQGHVTEALDELFKGKNRSEKTLGKISFTLSYYLAENPEQILVIATNAKYPDSKILKYGTMSLPICNGLRLILSGKGMKLVLKIAEEKIFKKAA